MRIRWQQALRAVLALFAIGFAVAVFLAIRERQAPPHAGQAAPRTDPKAIAESTRGESIVARGTQQDYKVEYERLLTYEDGSLRFETVKVAVPGRQGRDLHIAAQRAAVTNQQNDLSMDGDVRLTTSDGLTVTAGSATYQNADGMLRAPGPVAFTQGRMRGQGVGATYDRGRDVLWLLADAKIVVDADPATGTGQVDVTAGSAGFARRDRYLRFEGAVRLVRDTTVIEADSAMAYLAADEDRLRLLELRGSSRVTLAAPPPGQLESMTARDMNLAYAEDGRTLQQATLAGDATTHIAGPAGQRGRRLSADWIEFVLAPDGTTLLSLTARDRVELEIPGVDAASPTRRIRSVSLDGHGEPGKGLTAVRFVDQVEFREVRAARGEAPAIDRTARSRTLDTVMQPGLGAIDRATFGGGVTFRDGATEATAPDAVYDLAGAALRLTAGQGTGARVSDERVTVDARTIDLALDSDGMKADGDVRSLLKAGGGGGADGARRRPGMLREDQPVNVTARALAYDGATGVAVYSGDARLWQGETAVQGATITLDDRQGNLAAKGGVRSTWRLEDRDPKTGAVERKTSVATADDLLYEDAQRRATYTGDARLNGPEGDLRAPRIELFLAESGSALERLEAYTAVRLDSPPRTSTGTRLTYYAADARYVMSGAPVRVLEQLPAECRETLGKVLTFFRSTDTILVDGNEERTQTTSGGKCPGPPPAQ
jgi:LPS export ABC transporter protein LptC